MAVTERFTIPEATAHILESPFEVTSGSASCVELELVEPMAISFGTYASRPSGWLGIDCKVGDTAVTGYGEGATLPQAVFTDDSGRNIASNLEELSWVLMSPPEQTVNDALEHIQAHVFADGKQYPTARLAAEMAVLDAATRAHGISVKELISVSPEIVEVPYGKSIGGTDTASIVRQVEAALAQSAQKIKLKISPDSFYAVDSAIRTIYTNHLETDIMVDANGSFDPHDPIHLAMLSRLDEFGLLMLEEPVSRIGVSKGLDAVRYMRRVLPNLATPICLDDCLKTLGDCKIALGENLADVINIKPGRIGSFLLSLDLVQLATDNLAQVMVGGMLEGTPGRCMTTLLGAYCVDAGFVVPGDLSLAQDRLVADLVPPEKQLQLSERGAILLPTGPGWGF